MMAYKCDGADAAAKLPKFTRTVMLAEADHTEYVKFVRIINTGVRVTGGGGGSARPAAGQILPRGT